MDEYQKAALDKKLKLQRGAAIIEGTQGKYREDGYTNVLNKYGTSQDNSTAYQYAQEPFADDMQLIRLYEGNGLFAKIIDRPAEEAVKHGLDIDFGRNEVSDYVARRLDELEYEDKFATAEKWSRLYGGSIIVMLCDDGGGLEDPLDWDNVRSIEELRVFERAVVQPDYSALYNFNFNEGYDKDRPFGEPEYYSVFSIYGYFIVHRSRCLVFRNGRLPEQTTNALYRYFGIPEYVKLRTALRECLTSHQDGVKLLDRSVQAIYKMKGLSSLLSTDAGEDNVLKRLQVIDMARGILNSIAIDNDGEDYTFQTMPLSGVKDVIDSTCNMLSAVCNIPQTLLFGRSPAGMNDTGAGDLENYYNMVENIQKRNMKANTRTLIDLILRQGVIDKEIDSAPEYKVQFTPLWSLSEQEQANVDKTKAETEQVKAATAQIYMDASVVDPSEVRRTLAKDGDFQIEDIVTEDTVDDIDIPEDTFDLGENPMGVLDGQPAEALDGGIGSGNFGHAGRPGKLGGSQEGDKAQKRCGEIFARKKEISAEMKKKMDELESADDDSRGNIVAQLKSLSKENKALDKELEEVDPNSKTNVSKRLSESGHPTKEAIMESLPDEWKNQYSYEDEQSYGEAFSAKIGNWSGEGYKDLKDDYVINKAIELSSEKWHGGDLYRGISVSDEDIGKMVKGGSIKMSGLSSWSSDISPAMQFATTEKSPVLIIDKTKGTRNALPIAQMSLRNWEKEVIYGKDQTFTIKNVQTKDVDYLKSSNGSSANFSEPAVRKVTVIEVEAK